MNLETPSQAESLQVNDNAAKAPLTQPIDWFNPYSLYTSRHRSATTWDNAGRGKVGNRIGWEAVSGEDRAIYGAGGTFATPSQLSFTQSEKRRSAIKHSPAPSRQSLTTSHLSKLSFQSGASSPRLRPQINTEVEFYVDNEYLNWPLSPEHDSFFARLKSIDIVKAVEKFGKIFVKRKRPTSPDDDDDSIWAYVRYQEAYPEGVVRAEDNGETTLYVRVEDLPDNMDDYIHAQDYERYRTRKSAPGLSSLNRPQVQGGGVVALPKSRPSSSASRMSSRDKPLPPCPFHAIRASATAEAHPTPAKRIKLHVRLPSGSILKIVYAPFSTASWGSSGGLGTG
ncbi:hypothetical protein NMY22_g8329 [Coprinellus aureogranulatus]|nr:hypothetical protein NMY22_g8329 [Coprinellus aureogranulatus]